jgi:hypothetical protein
LQVLLIRLIRSAAFCAASLPSTLSEIASFFRRLYLVAPRPLCKLVSIATKHKVKTKKVCLLVVLLQLDALLFHSLPILFQKIYFILPSALLRMYKADPIRSARVQFSVNAWSTLPDCFSSSKLALATLPAGSFCTLQTAGEGSKTISLRTTPLPFLVTKFVDAMNPYSFNSKSIRVFFC